MEFKLDRALDRFIIVEPAEKSTVLKADEISTVFLVISVGEESKTSLSDGDFVIVTPNSIEKSLIGQKEVYYVRESDIIAKVSLRTKDITD